MTQSLYITGAEHGSGKSVVALGLMDLLAGRGERLGFFRPVLPGPGDSDPLTALMIARYQLPFTPEQLYGVTAAEARELVQQDRYGELLKRILEKYRGLKASCERVVCAGTDYASVAGVLEFDFNLDAANNLGCLLVPVVRAHRREAADIVQALRVFQELLEERDADVLATFINRVPVAQLDAVGRGIAPYIPADQPLIVLPEERSLGMPTVGDIATGLQATVIHGGPETLSREVHDYKVAAMRLPGFLDHLAKDALVITPADRDDILVGTIAAYESTAYPQISGLLLTGGMVLPAQVERLIKGLGEPPFAILSVPGDTFSAAVAVTGVSPGLSPDNERKLAAALGLMERHGNSAGLLARLETARTERVTPLMFEHELVQRARENKRHIVLPEGEEERILRAAEVLSLRGVADLTLLGNVDAVRARIEALDLRLEDVKVVDPLTSPWRDTFADSYYELRKHKGISRDMAYDTVTDVSYFGTLMVHHGFADGMVSGSVHTTQHTIRPSFEIIKTRPGTRIVSSVFFMCLADRVLVYGDCAVNPDPDAEQLADIAISSAATAQAFGVEPRVAMLSYSTGQSGKGAAVDKVRAAVELARDRAPQLLLDGPIQYDAAVDMGVARTKLPDSQVAGNATVLIFPDLNTGNNTYKAVQRTAGAVAVGPVLQGLNKPVNDLSRGCTVTDIVNTVAITAIQAQAARDA